MDTSEIQGGYVEKAEVPKPKDMYVSEGVEVKGELNQIEDYRRKEDPKEFVGVVFYEGKNRKVIHVPTDRGVVMKQMANDLLVTWRSADLDPKETSAAVRALIGGANVAVMKTQTGKGPIYRFYDGNDPKTFEPGESSGAPRNKIVVEGKFVI